MYLVPAKKKKDDQYIISYTRKQKQLGSVKGNLSVCFILVNEQSSITGVVELF